MSTMQFGRFQIHSATPSPSPSPPPEPPAQEQNEEVNLRNKCQRLNEEMNVLQEDYRRFRKSGDLEQYAIAKNKYKEVDIEYRKTAALYNSKYDTDGKPIAHVASPPPNSANRQDVPLPSPVATGPLNSVNGQERPTPPPLSHATVVVGPSHNVPDDNINMHVDEEESGGKEEEAVNAQLTLGGDSVGEPIPRKRKLADLDIPSEGEGEEVAAAVDAEVAKKKQKGKGKGKGNEVAKEAPAKPREAKRRVKGSETRSQSVEVRSFPSLTSFVLIFCVGRRRSHQQTQQNQQNQQTQQARRPL